MKSIYYNLILITIISNVIVCDDLLRKILTNVLSYEQELGLLDGQKINLVRPFSFK